MLKFEEITKELAAAVIEQAIWDLKEEGFEVLRRYKSKTYRYTQFTSKLSFKEYKEALEFVFSDDLERWLQSFNINIDPEIIRKKIKDFRLKKKGVVIT